MTTVSAATVVHEHFGRSIAATGRFFAAEAPAVAVACRRVADRFIGGATLFVIGEGAQASDAQHVAVEFVHPVIVGKRALPAIALAGDSGVRTACGQETPLESFAAPLRALATPGDILLGICADRVAPSVRVALVEARARGMLTVLVSGPAGPGERVADVELIIDERSPLIVQEVAETVYHVLWELVHVFFETGDAPPMFPYLPPPSPLRVHDDLLADVQESTRQKSSAVCDLRAVMLKADGRRIADAARDMADRIRRGGRVLAFGNGGSATDAQDVAADCLAPPDRQWHRLPALALTNDIGTITAIGNDVGYEYVFSRQLTAFGRERDVALAFSTSGTSRNLVAAMAEARSRGLLTVAMSGGDGGTLAHPGAVDYCFTAPSQHLPRIQEAHATTWHALLSAVQEELRS